MIILKDFRKWSIFCFVLKDRLLVPTSTANLYLILCIKSKRNHLQYITGDIIKRCIHCLIKDKKHAGKIPRFSTTPCHRKKVSNLYGGDVVLEKVR